MRIGFVLALLCVCAIVAATLAPPALARPQNRGPIRAAGGVNRVALALLIASQQRNAQQRALNIAAQRAAEKAAQRAVEKAVQRELRQAACD